MISDYEIELRNIDREIKALTEKKARITKEIKNQFTDKKSVKFGGINVVFCPSYYALEFDVETFLENEPTIAEKYLKLVHKDESIRIMLDKEQKNEL